VGFDYAVFHGNMDIFSRCDSGGCSAITTAGTTFNPGWIFRFRLHDLSTVALVDEQQLRGRFGSGEPAEYSGASLVRARGRVADWDLLYAAAV
jgi:hypothetical protein